METCVRNVRKELGIHLGRELAYGRKGSGLGVLVPIDKEHLALYAALRVQQCGILFLVENPKQMGVSMDTENKDPYGGVAPLVSVIVPIYNCEAYIAQCLQSLQNQTLPDFEALCVDDGSSDASLDCAKAAVAGDPRFHFDALPENRGQSAARNVALDKATGEYLVLLDADDYLVPEALEKLVVRAKSQQLDDLYFSGRSFYDGTESFRLVHEDYSARPSFEGVASGRELFTFFEEHDGFFPQAPLRMVRRDLVLEHGIRFFEGIIHEDLLFTLQTMLTSKRSSFLNEELYMRRVHMGSTMAQPRRTLANIRGHFVCMRWLQSWLDAHIEELDRPFIKAIAHRMTAYRTMMEGDWYNDIDEADQERFLAALSNEELLDFLTSVIEPGYYVEEVYHSKTYQFGNTLVSAPRALRDKAEEILRFRKER